MENGVETLMEKSFPLRALCALLRTSSLLSIEANPVVCYRGKNIFANFSWLTMFFSVSPKFSDMFCKSECLHGYLFNFNRVVHLARVPNLFWKARLAVDAKCYCWVVCTGLIWAHISSHKRIQFSSSQTYTDYYIKKIFETDLLLRLWGFDGIHLSLRGTMT